VRAASPPASPPTPPTRYFCRRIDNSEQNKERCETFSYAQIEFLPTAYAATGGYKPSRTCSTRTKLVVSHRILMNAMYASHAHLGGREGSRRHDIFGSLKIISST
jgi:hypothetical protein